MQVNPTEHLGELLIVDDLADNLRVLSTTLSNHGYRVRAVRNGAMALLGVKAAPPDLILLDIRMPEMDGFEVCRQLKADPQLSDIPIIFLSASDEIEDKAKAFEVGGIDYITKPFQTAEVLTRVNNQLTIQNLKKQLAAQQQQLAALAINPAATPQPEGDGGLPSQAITAIATILDYSNRLSQKPEIDPEQYTALRIIHENGQILQSLVNTR